MVLPAESRHLCSIAGQITDGVRTAEKNIRRGGFENGGGVVPKRGVAGSNLELSLMDYFGPWVRFTFALEREPFIN